MVSKNSNRLPKERAVIPEEQRPEGHLRPEEGSARTRQVHQSQEGGGGQGVPPFCQQGE